MRHTDLSWRTAGHVLEDDGKYQQVSGKTAVWRLHAASYACWLLLGAFEKFRKATISFMSVRPSCRPHGTIRLSL